MSESFCAGLFFCWFLPLGLLGGVVLFWGAVRAGWRHRGLEKGELYCGSCRFNLRGCASWNCPECGAHLDDGWVMTPGHDLPMSLGPRLVLATAACAGPLVVACFLLVWAMPFNYETDRTLRLKPYTSGMTSELTVTGEDAWGWLGGGLAERVRLYASGRSSSQFSPRIRESYYTPLPVGDDALVPDALWETVVVRCGLDEKTPAWQADARSDLVDALRYVSGEASLEPMPGLQRYRVTKREYEELEPRPWFVFGVIFLAAVVWGFLMRWVVRWHGAVMAQYLQRHGWVVEKVGRWIEESRARAGLGGKSEQ